MHVIKEIPFGEKSIRLSTNEVVTVPNIIRMLIPESIVRQYLAYAEESNVKKKISHLFTLGMFIAQC